MIATIEAVSKKDRGPSSCKINEEWYKFWAYGKSPCKNFNLIEKGATLDITIETKDEGQYGLVKYITNASQPSQPSQPSSPSKPTCEPDRQALIVNQSCLKAAVEALGPGKSMADYEKAAERFSNWAFNYQPVLTGQALQEAVEAVNDPFAD